jgi:hypothetical protein
MIYGFYQSFHKVKLMFDTSLDTYSIYVHYIVLRRFISLSHHHYAVEIQLNLRPVLSAQVKVKSLTWSSMSYEKARLSYNVMLERISCYLNLKLCQFNNRVYILIFESIYLKTKEEKNTLNKYIIRNVGG